MLSNEELERCLKAVSGVDYVLVEGDGYHYQLTIVTDIFLDKFNDINSKIQLKPFTIGNKGIFLGC